MLIDIFYLRFSFLFDACFFFLMCIIFEPKVLTSFSFLFLTHMTISIPYLEAKSILFDQEVVWHLYDS